MFCPRRLSFASRPAPAAPAALAALAAASAVLPVIPLGVEHPGAGTVVIDGAFEEDWWRGCCYGICSDFMGVTRIFLGDLMGFKGISWTCDGIWRVP